MNTTITTILDFEDEFTEDEITELSILEDEDSETCYNPNCIYLPLGNHFVTVHQIIEKHRNKIMLKLTNINNITENDLYPFDIQLLMLNTNCTREQSIQSLIRHKGNFMEAHYEMMYESIHILDDKTVCYI